MFVIKNKRKINPRFEIGNWDFIRTYLDKKNLFRTDMVNDYKKKEEKFDDPRKKNNNNNLEGFRIENFKLIHNRKKGRTKEKSFRGLRIIEN